MSVCEIRPATAEDFQEFYGRPAPFTLRAIVVVKDGKPVGFGGYYLIDGAALVFTDITPEIDVPSMYTRQVRRTARPLGVTR